MGVIVLNVPAALPAESNSSTHWIGGWVGHVAGLNGFGVDNEA